MSIKTKIIIVISLTFLLTVGTTTIALIKVQHNKMIRAKLEETEFLCDLVRKTTASAMKQGNTAEVQQILEHIGENKKIPVLRILSPDGTVLKSTIKAEIGAKSGEFIKESSKDTFLKPTFTDETTINYFHHIPNQQECHGCHDKNNPVIGIIHLKHDISEDVSTFLTVKRILILSNIVVVVLVSVILGLLLSRLIMNPLRNLLNAMHSLEGGDWEANVRVTSNDELGIIGRTFNSMVQEVTSLHQKGIVRERELSKMRTELEHKNKVEDLNTQLEFKIKELETANKAITSLSKEVKNKNIRLENAVERLKRINEIGIILTSIIETQELIKLIIQTTADLIPAEMVTLHLKKHDKPELTFQFVRGSGIQTIQDFALSNDQEYLDLFKYGKPVLKVNGHPEQDADSGSAGAKIAVPLKIKGQIIGAMLIENAADNSMFSDDEMQLMTNLANQAVVALENAWLYESVKGNYFSTIQSLVNALEANDRFTRGHSERVRLLAVELGRFMGLDFRELELLEHASILHDIGKIGIDNFILQKNGKLSAKEYGIIKTHPLIGEQILGPINTLDSIRRTIIQHHERFDGNGYPFGLKGNEISLKSKILSVADTFDAMMSERPYRSALSLCDVKAELVSNAGSQFDPHVVDAFVNLLAEDESRIMAITGYSSVAAGS